IDQTPLTLTVELSGRPAGAVLEVRKAGEATYQPIPMAPAGPGYFTTTLPPERVVAPRLEYFVEAVRQSGQAVSVVGSPDAPLTTTVHPVLRAAAPLGHESAISIVTDYADYNRLRNNDRAWQT